MERQASLNSLNNQGSHARERNCKRVNSSIAECIGGEAGCIPLAFPMQLLPALTGFAISLVPPPQHRHVHVSRICKTFGHQETQTH